MKVMVVDDDVLLRRTIAELLQHASHTVAAFGLAEQALGRLGEERPDVVLLDLGMPPGEMTGVEFLNRIRESPAWSSLPVIIVSGMSDVVNPDLLAGLAVTAVLQKPFSGADLVAALDLVR
jgi:CheY-like chemotaxis protein